MNQGKYVFAQLAEFLPKAMGYRAVFQMDKATSQGQIILGNNRKCC